MSYIDRNLLEGEQILFRTRKHVIIFLPAVVLTVLALFAAYYMSNNPILSMLQWVPGFLALIVWGAVGLNYAFSEFAVTNKRVMMREGFFTRHSNEMRVSTISQVNVDQSIIGQMLDYGTVSINAFGAFDYYPTISKPTKFQRAVNQQLDKAVRA